jgi:Ca2+-binding EF-hand superfamily protein
MRPHVFATMVLMGLPLAAQPTLATAGTAQGRQAQARQAQPRETMRWRAMDTNRDGRITREEWKGTARSFRVHDWNSDGVLSENEVRMGGARDKRNEVDYDETRRWEFSDWTETGFSTLDHNKDGRISRGEWHYDVETFRRTDRNRDGILTRAEFVTDVIDDDRGDRFDDLDADRSGAIEQAEWHGSADAFTWLDRDRNRILSRKEVVGEEEPEPDLFASLDVNRDGKVALNEWHWSRASFNQQDRNRDGMLSRYEVANVEAGPVGTSGTTSTVFLVDSTQRWVDTGIDVRAGDTLSITATGTIVMSTNDADQAAPAGSQTGRRAAEAPLRDAAAGALIGRIGMGTPVLIGASQVMNRITTGGRLYLGVNDDYLLDNRGQFRVTVTVKPR